MHLFKDTNSGEIIVLIGTAHEFHEDIDLQSTLRQQLANKNDGKNESTVKNQTNQIDKIFVLIFLSK
jgi:hypothetical protein